MKNCNKLTIELKSMNERGNRRIHYWITAEPGTGKTLATNFITTEYRAIKANYRDNWTEMNDQVRIIVFDEFVH